MSAHDLVNAILVIGVVAIFIARSVRKFATSRAQRGGPKTAWSASPPAGVALAQQQLLPPAPAPVAAPKPARRTRPARPAAQGSAPAARPAASYAAEAAAAFPTLDLTLPGAEAPAGPGDGLARPRGKRGAFAPAGRGWGAGAIVAMEILGPPVSLRSGATLGAPHAF
jgi:hypothetical protein